MKVLGDNQSQRKVIRQWLLLAVLLLAGVLVLLWPVAQPPVPPPDEIESLPPLTGGRTVQVWDVPPVEMPSHALETPIRPRRPEAARPAAPAEPPAANVVPGERILTFFNAAERDRFITEATAAGLEIADRMDFANAVRVRETTAGQLDAVLRRLPAPTGNYDNHRVYVPPIEDEVEGEAPDEGPYLGVGEQVLPLMGLYEWNPQMGAGAVIALLDGHIDRSALRASARLRMMEPFASAALDDNAALLHGTAVASLLAGMADSESGVAPGAEFLSYPVVGADGTGDAFTLAKALVDAVEQGAQIINLSIGSRESSPLLQQAVEHALRSGVLIVAAAGNDGRGVLHFPAAYDGVLAVGASDASGRRLPFSNTGANLALLAPGLGLAAAAPAGESTGFSGTSASAPLVTGALALLVSQGRLSSADAIRRLRETALGATGQERGLIDAGRALNMPAGVDVVVMIPYLRRMSDGRLVVVSPLANRGAATAHDVLVTMQFEDNPPMTTVLRLTPGAVARPEWVFPGIPMPPPGWMLDVHAEARGVPDVDERNNRFRGRLRLPDSM